MTENLERIFQAQFAPPFLYTDIWRPLQLIFGVIIVWCLITLHKRACFKQHQLSFGWSTSRFAGKKRKKKHIVPTRSTCAKQTFFSLLNSETIYCFVWFVPSPFSRLWLHDAANDPPRLSSSLWSCSSHIQSPLKCGSKDNEILGRSDWKQLS